MSQIGNYKDSVHFLLIGEIRNEVLDHIKKQIPEHALIIDLKWKITGDNTISLDVKYLTTSYTPNSTT